MVYEHPHYTPESVRAQQQIAALSDDRLAYAGAYHGWGFHEDGALSGVRAAASLGRDLGRARVEPGHAGEPDAGQIGGHEPDAAIYRTSIPHVRQTR